MPTRGITGGLLRRELSQVCDKSVSRFPPTESTTYPSRFSDGASAVMRSCSNTRIRAARMCTKKMRLRH